MNRKGGILSSKKGIDFPSSSMLYLILIALVFMFLLGTGVKSYAGWVSDKDIDMRCRATLIANSVLRIPSDIKTMKGIDEEQIAADCVRGPDILIKYSKIKSNSGTKEAIKYNIMKEIAQAGVACDYRYMGDIHERVPFKHEPGTYCGICNDITMDDSIKKEFALTSSGDDNTKLKDFYTYLLNNRNPRTGNYFTQDLYGYSKTVSDKQEFARLLTARLKQVYGSEIVKNPNNPSEKMQFSNIGSQKIEQVLQSFDTNIDPTHTYNWVHIIRKDDRVLKKIQANEDKNTAAKYKLLTCAGLIAVGVGGAAFTAGASLAVTGSLIGAGEVLACSGSLFDVLIGQISFTGLSDYQPNYVMNTVLVDQKDIASLGCDHMYGLSKESIKKK